jgi:hypothetical protein
MSVINDLRAKIAKLNGKVFTIAEVNSSYLNANGKPNYLASGYKRLYELVENGEVERLSSGKQAKSVRYKATDKLKLFVENEVVKKSKMSLPGWRDKFPGYFTKPTGFKVNRIDTHKQPV